MSPLTAFALALVALLVWLGALVAMIDRLVPRAQRALQLDAAYRAAQDDFFTPADPAPALEATHHAASAAGEPTEKAAPAPRAARPATGGSVNAAGSAPATARVIGFRQVMSIQRHGDEVAIHVRRLPIFAPPTPQEIEAGLARLQSHANQEASS